MSKIASGRKRGRPPGKKPGRFDVSPPPPRSHKAKPRPPGAQVVPGQVPDPLGAATPAPATARVDEAPPPLPDFAMPAAADMAPSVPGPAEPPAPAPGADATAPAEVPGGGVPNPMHRPPEPGQEGAGGAGAPAGAPGIAPAAPGASGAVVEAREKWEQRRYYAPLMMPVAGGVYLGLKGACHLLDKRAVEYGDIVQAPVKEAPSIAQVGAQLLVAMQGEGAAPADPRLTLGLTLIFSVAALVAQQPDKKPAPRPTAPAPAAQLAAAAPPAVAPKPSAPAPAPEPPPVPAVIQAGDESDSAGSLW